MTVPHRPPIWADSHCHVHDPRIPDGCDAAIQAARESGVHTMITVGCDRPTSEAALAVAHEHHDVFATIGLHPHDASHGVDTIRDLLDQHHATPECVAVGETGLDYYYEHSPRNIQKAAFAEQIQIAHELNLPLVIHTRDAWDDTFDVLDAERTPDQTVFHCFTGGPDEAAECVRRGAYLSFSGIVTFKGAPEVQEAARLCPLDQMLVETDSPYLAPVPHRGKVNRPAWVADVGRFVAELREVHVETVAEATSKNTRALFRLPD